MTAPRYAAAPIRFLIGVIGLWVVARGLALAGWPEPASSPAPAAAHRSKPVQVRRPMLATVAVRDARPHREVVALVRPSRPPSRAQAEAPLSALIDQPLSTPIEAVPIRASLSLAALTPLAPPPLLFPAEPLPVSMPSRLSGSAWLFLHGGSPRALAPSGELGGSQAGARLLYRLDAAGHVAASARLSRSLAGPAQTEAAVGLDWRPFKAVPLHLTFDRRIAIDRGGRNAWTLGVSGGAYAVRLAPEVRLDAYGEAGVVGATARDLYADGGGRITRSVDLGQRRSLGLGGGAWGAAQPHAARLDVGPSAVLRLPLDRATLALTLDWRWRIAGTARPNSGPALTLGFDF